MKLSHLLAALPSRTDTEGLPQLVDQDIAGLTTDSKQAREGFVFIAIRGSKTDGHQFLPTVCAQGASAVVVENMALVPPWYWGAVIHVQDSRRALDRLASHFYSDPSARLFCVGVTGTNGKTTTTHLVEQVLVYNQKPTGVIGTIDHHLGGHVWPTTMTTPDPIALQSRLQEFVQGGAVALSMEVSSHALKQARADSVQFDTVVFTNFTRDHLDYHGTMEDYFLSKQRLFLEVLGASKKQKTALINVDDPEQRRLQVASGARRWHYGQAQEAELCFSDPRESFEKSVFQLKTPQGECEVEIALPGRFNIYNAVAAIGVGLSAGLSLRQCRDALVGFSGVRGRLEIVPHSLHFFVFVDYAHTDDALSSVLSTLHDIRRKSQPSARLITVFGCGGDRDRGKRPLMMRVALAKSEVVVVTSDNPRSEDPEKIIDEILSETSLREMGSRVYREGDRKKAIALALNLAQPGDVVLVAGKGHETYQIIGDKRLYFSDIDVIKEVLG